MRTLRFAHAWHPRLARRHPPVHLLDPPLLARLAQAIVKAEPLEAQLIDWIRDFQPDPQLRAHVLGTLRAEAQNNGGDNAERRRELHGQLDRLRDLYVLGDLTKNQYVLKRQALQEELERTSPPLDPRLDQAEAVLSDFARFWQTEPSPRRAAETARKPVRSNLARQRRHRRRQAATAVRPLLQDGRTAQPPAQAQAG